MLEEEIDLIADGIKFIVEHEDIIRDLYKVHKNDVMLDQSLLPKYQDIVSASL